MIEWGARYSYRCNGLSFSDLSYIVQRFLAPIKRTMKIFSSSSQQKLDLVRSQSMNIDKTISELGAWKRIKVSFVQLILVSFVFFCIVYLFLISVFFSSILVCKVPRPCWTRNSSALQLFGELKNERSTDWKKKYFLTPSHYLKCTSNDTFVDSF